MSCRGMFLMLVCVCAWSSFTVRAQGHTLYNITSFVSFATGERTPFWMASNSYGIVPIEANNGYLQAKIFTYQPVSPHFSFHAGLDMVAVTPRYRNIFVQQAFAEMGYDNRLFISIGSHSGADDRRYSASLLDASLSSGDMALSANARPIPEINIYIPEFISVPWTNEWLQFKGNFAVGRSFDTDYLLSFVRSNQDYNRNVLWHHKSLHIRAKDMKGDFPFTATVGIRHVAQWGGVSTNPAAGTQPHSLKDFVRVIMGAAGGEDASISDQVNVLGNHYGTYDFMLGYEREKYALHVYHQHLFDDNSGMEFYNGLDGLIGIQLDFADGDSQRRLLSGIVVERLSTLNQSGPFHYIWYDHDKYPGYGGGGDNYYNNGEYVTGASYFNRSLGSPLLLSPEYNTDGRLGFFHNRVRAWHLGAKGYLSKDISYRLLCSEAESLGRTYNPSLTVLRTLSLMATLTYACPRDWFFSVMLGADRGNWLNNNIGAGISVTKTGVF